MTLPELRSPLRLARSYLERGWEPVPVKRMGKAPKHKGWLERTIDSSNIDDFFKGEDGNVGIKLGAPSSGLSDVDLDHSTAMKLAPMFLPPSASRFGRDAKPDSHWLYVCAGANGILKFAMPKSSGSRTIVELRAGGQTVFPGSIYHDGSPIRWDEDGDVPVVTHEDLVSSVRRLAAACVLLDAWPEGNRHDVCMAMAGILFRADWEADRAEFFIKTVADAGGTPRRMEVEHIIRDTYRKGKDGQNIVGATRLKELLGADVVDKILDHLEISRGFDCDIVWRPADLPAIVDKVERGMLADDSQKPVFKYGGRYVTILEKSPISVTDKFGGSLPPIPIVHEYDVHALRERVMRSMTFGGAKGPISCPFDVAHTLRSRGGGAAPELTGIVGHPTLRPDRSIIDQPGYDKRTGVFAHFNVKDFKLPKTQPSRSDAEASLKWIRGMFLAEFPFASAVDRDVAVAALMTGVVRKALGECPAFLISAPTAATGKSALADIIGVVMTGVGPGHQGWPKSSEELEKVILSVMLQGIPIVSIDNVSEPLGGDVLNRVVTSEKGSARVLGVNRIAELPVAFLLLFTGNNVAIEGDTATRIFGCYLNAEVERPDQRRFKRKDVKAWAKQHRADAIYHCLTIIRAAGRKPKLAKPSRFAAWDDMVRFPLIRAGGEDVLKKIDDAVYDDPIAERRSKLLESLYMQFGDTAFRSIQVADVIERIQDNSAAHERDLQECLRGLINRRKGLHSQSIGLALSKLENLIINGMLLKKESDPGTKTKMFWVAPQNDESRERLDAARAGIDKVLPDAPAY